MNFTTRCRHSLVLTLLVYASTGATYRLSADEPNSSFTVLFSGEGLEGWKHSGNWRVADGAIERTGKGGSLVYDKAPLPNDFELQFEWKVAKGSNSGVYYRPGQYEYQILDNAVHRDGKNPRTSAASLYFCMPPSHDATAKVGDWNQGRIICKGTIIQHWLNGKKVVGFDYTDPKYQFEVDLLRARGGDVAARGAKLSLQDHGDPVWYRNIRLREIAPDEELDLTPVQPAEIPEEALAAEKKKLAGIVANRKKAAERKKREAADKKAKALDKIDN